MKKIILSIILVLICTSLVLFKNSFKVSSYNSKIDLTTYFSFHNGNTYNSNDSIFISKFSKPNEKLLIIDYIKGDTLTTKTNSKLEDLRKYKFVDLYKRKNTDTILPLKKGVYILELGKGEDVFRDMIFVNDETQKDEDIDVFISLSDYSWISYSDFGGRSNYIDIITPNHVKFFHKLKLRIPFYENYGVNSSDSYYFSKNRPNSQNNKELNYLSLNKNKIYSSDNSNFKFHCVVSELPLISLIDSLGIKYRIIDSKEFESLDSSKENKLFVFNGHSEYWSSRMMGKLKILKKTNNFLFFSGNNIYREVFDDGRLRVINQVINKKTVTELVGTFYDSSDYLLNSTLKINKEHFLFDGIDVGEIGGNYVMDHETDKVNEFTPYNTEVLGVGTNNNNGDLVLLKNLNNKYLLNTSSIGSFNGLKEKNFRKFIVNYINFSLNKY
jgi:hypothetical protein